MNKYKVITHVIDINPPFEELPWCAFYCPFEEEDHIDYFAGNCGWLDDQGYYAEGATEAAAVFNLFTKNQSEAKEQDKKEIKEIYFKNHKRES